MWRAQADTFARLGLESWHCGGCTAFRCMGCLPGCFPLGSLCPRSRTKPCCGVIGAGALAPLSLGSVVRRQQPGWSSLSIFTVGAKMCAPLCVASRHLQPISLSQSFSQQPRGLVPSTQGPWTGISRLWLSQLDPQSEGLPLKNFSDFKTPFLGWDPDPTPFLCPPLLRGNLSCIFGCIGVLLTSSS